jgi:hypothetical protein
LENLRPRQLNIACPNSKLTGLLAYANSVLVVNLVW